MNAKEYIEMSRALRAAESRMSGLMCPPDDERDRERIDADRVATRARIDEMTATMAATPADVVAEARRLTVSYPCAGARDGCTTRVRVQGDYCGRCACDAD